MRGRASPTADRRAALSPLASPPGPPPACSTSCSFP